MPQKQYEGKIIWAEMTNTPCFAYDTQGFYINQTCYFIPTNDKYLYATLNSKLIYFYMRQMASNLGDGAFRWIKQFIEKLSIPKITESNQHLADRIVALVDEILTIKANCHSEGALATEESHTKPKRDVSASPQHDKINNCHSERSEESLQNNRDVSLSMKTQHDKQDSDCHSEPALAGEESLSKELRDSKRDVSGIRPQHDKIPDTSNLESEIDSLVYQLYNLTDEEIKIIGGNNG